MSYGIKIRIEVNDHDEDNPSDLAWATVFDSTADTPGAAMLEAARLARPLVRQELGMPLEPRDPGKPSR